jgi:hypothetical protein
MFHLSDAELSGGKEVSGFKLKIQASAFAEISLTPFILCEQWFL